MQIEYLIQWKGYSSNENTWTSEKNLNCPAKLAEFEATLQKKIVSFLLICVSYQLYICRFGSFLSINRN